MKLTNADMLYLHLNDWAWSVSPTGYESEEEHKEREIKYATILECMKRVDKYLLKPRGKWIEENKRISSTKFECSECGGIAYFNHGVTGRNMSKRKKQCEYRFCPNCGARMGVYIRNEEDD